MSSEELEKILELHALWLSDNGGRRADLRDADLREANLQRADLRDANLRDADLQMADLQWADLRWPDLRPADLRDADLDYSCFPLWSGGSRFKCDLKLVYQLLAHICTLDFDDTEGIKELVLSFAIKSHRAKDLGLIGDEKVRSEE